MSHRATITKEQPSLPHRASRHFLYMYDVFRAAYESANGDEMTFRKFVNQYSHGRASRDGGITVTPIARPEIDVDRLVQLLIAHAKGSRAKPANKDEEAA